MNRDLMLRQLGDDLPDYTCIIRVEEFPILQEAVEISMGFHPAFPPDPIWLPTTHPWYDDTWDPGSLG